MKASLKLHLDATGIIFIPLQLRKETQTERSNTGSVLLLFNSCPWTDSLNLTVKVMRPLQMISQLPLLSPQPASPGEQSENAGTVSIRDSRHQDWILRSCRDLDTNINKKRETMFVQLHFYAYIIHFSLTYTSL